MEKFQTLKIDNKTYDIIDTLERVTIPDSFVFPSNKIGTGSGHREIYFGQKTDKELKKFLEKEEFNLDSFFLKDDLIKYLNEVKEEYFNPEQEYQKKSIFKELWIERMKEIDGLERIIPLNITENIGRKKKIHVYMLFQ